MVMYEWFLLREMYFFARRGCFGVVKKLGVRVRDPSPPPSMKIKIRGGVVFPRGVFALKNSIEQEKKIDTKKPSYNTQFIQKTHLKKS